MGFWAYSWILIPIAAILVGAFTEWLKFKGKQQELGTSTHELELTVETQQKALAAAQETQDALVRRIQNLEAIVTSQVWDAVHDESLPTAEKQKALSAARIQLDPPPEPSDADRVEQLARRLRV